MTEQNSTTEQADTTEDGKPATGTETDAGKPLGPNGEKALESERAARKAAEAQIAKYKQAEQEAERAKLSDSERLTAERDEHKTGRATAEGLALRYEIALDKGISKTLAKRLVGSTREELEADADELLGTIGGDTGKGAPPASKAREVLPRGGGEPDSEPDETDPAKLAAKVRRR